MHLDGLHTVFRSSFWLILLPGGIFTHKTTRVRRRLAERVQRVTCWTTFNLTSVPLAITVHHDSLVQLSADCSLSWMA